MSRNNRSSTVSRRVNPGARRGTPRIRYDVSDPLSDELADLFFNLPQRYGFCQDA